jgi:hypothetical protein
MAITALAHPEFFLASQLDPHCRCFVYRICCLRYQAVTGFKTLFFASFPGMNQLLIDARMDDPAHRRRRVFNAHGGKVQSA